MSHQPKWSHQSSIKTSAAFAKDLFINSLSLCLWYLPSIYSLRLFVSFLKEMEQLWLCHSAVMESFKRRRLVTASTWNQQIFVVVNGQIIKPYGHTGWHKKIFLVSAKMISLQRVKTVQRRQIWFYFSVVKRAKTPKLKKQWTII